MRDLRYAACAYTVRRCQKSQYKEVAKYRENVRSRLGDKIRFIGFGQFDRKIVSERSWARAEEESRKRKSEKLPLRSGIPRRLDSSFLGLTVIFLSSHERTHTSGMAHSDRRRTGKIFLSHIVFAGL